jgi:hypothetical protein
MITAQIRNVMWLNQWYCFDKVSDSNVILSQFENYSYGVNFSVDTTDKNEILSEYSPNQEFIHNVKNSPLELTFSFNNYTAFESKPSSATIRMIYHYNFDSPSGSLKVANSSLDFLNGTTNNWCLYNETAPVNITNPSELTYYIKVDRSQGGSSPKNMTIDYLAVRLN